MEGLRPLGVGELLDAAFKIYRQRFATMAIAVSITVLPAMVVAGLLLWSAIPETTTDPATGFTTFEGSIAPFLGAAALAGILYFLATTLATAACIRAVSSVYLGDEVTWRETLSFGMRRLPALIGLTLLTTLGMVVGLIACIIPGVILYVMWSLAVPALLVEGGGVGASMRRSQRLVEGSFWRVLGVLVLSAILTGIAGQAISLPLQLLGGLLGEAGSVV
ncbi:MAG TPA: hypothetical protein P5254_05595, partial [Aquihabitans sp.]|nr:hypothetical protein [Aquihabitans sp.]